MGNNVSVDRLQLICFGTLTYPSYMPLQGKSYSVYAANQSRGYMTLSCLLLRKLGKETSAFHARMTVSFDMFS